MKKLLMMIPAFILTGCSLYVEPHLSSSGNASIPEYEDSRVASNTNTYENVFRKMLSKRNSLVIESANAPAVDLAINQTNVSLLQSHCNISKEPLNAVQFYLELYNVDLGDIKSYSQNNLYFEVFGDGSASVYIMLQNNYILVACDEQLFMCLDYEGNLLESYHANSWKNYDGKSRDFLELFDDVYLQEDTMDSSANVIAQSVMIISSRTNFKPEYCQQIAKYVYDIKYSSVSEIFNHEENLWLVQTSDGEQIVLQIMVLNSGSNRESLTVTLVE